MELVFCNDKLISITNNEIIYTLKTPVDNSIFKTIMYDFIKLNNEGKFDKFADMQEIDFSFLYIFNTSSIKKEWIEKTEGTRNIVNKTINELYDISKGDEKKVFERLKNNGLGKLKVIESYNDQTSGLNAVVLQDTDGNYMINYPGTETETHDIFYDANNILQDPEKLKTLNKILISNLENDKNKELQKELSQYNTIDEEYWNLAIPYLLTIPQEKYNSLSNEFAKEANEQSNPYLKVINWWQSGFCSIFGLKDDIAANVTSNTISSITNNLSINKITKKINTKQKD